MEKGLLKLLHVDEKSDTKRVLFNGYKLEVLIPKSFFDLGIATISDDKLQTIGIFQVRYKELEKGHFKKASIKTPNEITVHFDDSYTARDVDNKLEESGNEEIDTDKDFDSTELDDLSDPGPIPSSNKETSEDDSAEEVKDESFIVFVINKGSVFIESLKIVQSTKNVEKYVRLLYAARLPRMSYEDVYRLHRSAEESNKTSFGLPSVAIAAICAEFCRYKKDTTIPFRMVMGTLKAGPNDFTMVSLKSLPDNVSTFSGITFENPVKSLVTTVSNAKTGKPEVITPIERITVKGETNDQPLQETVSVSEDLSNDLKKMVHNRL